MHKNHCFFRLRHRFTLPHEESKYYARLCIGCGKLRKRLCVRFLAAYALVNELPAQEPAMSEERLINIESKITYLEDTVQELNTAVYRQQNQIDRLRSLCESLVAHIRTLSTATGDDAPDGERPPHY